MNDEHKQLIAYMNTLYDLNEAGAEKNTLNAALNEFLEYTKLHFDDEERYMASVNYPDIEDHKDKHKKLFQDLSVYVSEFNRTGQVDIGFFNFLKLWLRGHIIYIDGKYKKFINELESSKA